MAKSVKMRRKFNKIKTAIFLSVTGLFFLIPVQAKNPPLRIAISKMAPPYVMQGKKQLYGFDVALMDYICATIKRDCQYQLMSFSELLPAVVNKATEIAIGSITITPERAEQVSFSLPYLISQSRFIGLKKLAKDPLSLAVLKNSKIGIKTGSIFGQQLQIMGVANPTIVSYKMDEDLIQALITGSIDLALIDEPAALYWQNNSSEQLEVLGKPYPYGSLGIAVNPADPALLQAINQSILQYQNNGQFTKNYKMYIEYF